MSWQRTAAGPVAARNEAVALSTGPGPPLHEPAPDHHVDVDSGQSSLLLESAALKMPVFEAEEGRRSRADKLEDHIERTARMRGDLAELRMKAHVQLKLAQDEWEELQVSRSGKISLKEARTQARPDLAKKLRDARWLIDRCTEEMERMGGDEYLSASRAYTLLSGG